MFQILRALWSRRKWWAISVFALCFASAASLIMTLPNIYRATATVLVSTGDAQALTGESNSGQDDLLDSVTAQVMSRARLQDMIEKFELYPGLKGKMSPEAVIERMRNDIQLERKATDQQQWGQNPVFAFTLSYQGWNPQIVTKVTNALVSSYVTENNQIRTKQINDTVNSLQAQMASIKAKLDDQQDRINAFKSSHMGELPEQQQVNLSTLAQLNLQLHESSENEIDAERRQADLLKQMTSSGDASVPQLEQELSDLRTKYTDNYPDVVHLKAQIAALKSQQSSGGGQTESPLQRQYNSLTAQIRTYKQEEEQLKAQIATYQGRVGNVPIFAEKLQTLNQGYAETQDVYSSLLKRYEKARLAEGTERNAVDQYRVLDSAIPPRNPAGPNRSRLLLISLILCLGLSAGVTFLMEQFDTSFHSAAELRAFTT
ncbi:MAG: GumC family protein, partial [Gammaproteobacteria bacterium]